MIEVKQIQIISQIETVFVVYAWGVKRGYFFRNYLNYSCRQSFNGDAPVYGGDTSISILDPFTAISLGLCTPEELNISEAAKSFIGLLQS